MREGTSEIDDLVVIFLVDDCFVGVSECVVLLNGDLMYGDLVRSERVS